MPEQGPFKIDKTTRITSMGSCFAREIKTVLLRDGYRYVQEEADKPAAKHAGAAWERVYNTFSMRQIFEYSFEDWKPDLRWWRAPVSGRIQDPYRRIILYDDLQEAEDDFRAHVVCSRKVLEEAEALIITLGLTEVWVDNVDNSVICLPAGPYVSEGGDMTRYRFEVTRYSGEPQESGTNSRDYGRSQSRLPNYCDSLTCASVGHVQAGLRCHQRKLRL